MNEQIVFFFFNQCKPQRELMANDPQEKLEKSVRCRLHMKSPVMRIKSGSGNMFVIPAFQLTVWGASG